MPFRNVTLVLLAVSAVAFVACGDMDDDGADGGGSTAELTVPPDSQVVVEAAPTVAPTATAEPATTAEPVDATENRVVNVANRGYNSYGDPDAPITMFEFSDFL